MSRKDRIDWTGFLEKRKRCDRKITWREIQMMVNTLREERFDRIVFQHRFGYSRDGMSSSVRVRGGGVASVTRSY